MIRSYARTGYTLRDLLVVIMIICVLLALSLPAIRAAREAARRSECTNNLKWISLALQNYHDTYKVLPMGAMHAGPPVTGKPFNDSKLGPSWWFGIIPYIHQTNLYDQILVKTQQAGCPSNYEFCARDMVAAGVVRSDINGRVYGTFSDYTPDYMRCPSSPLPAFESKTGLVILPSYVGITGGCDVERESQDYPNTEIVPGPEVTRQYWGGATCPYPNRAKGIAATPGGIITSSGMLPPGQRLAIDDCTDGTSNTIIVAEQSDWLYDQQPGSRQGYHGDAGWTVGGTANGGGWLSGTRRCGPVPTLDELGGPPAPWGADCWNLNTVRYPPNFKAVMGPPPLPGCSENHGINNPLQSPHPGGVLVGCVDGSVQFVNSSTKLDVLLRMAIRDDGANVKFQ